MKIHLSEIPAEGRHYDFSRETGELNDALGDLIQDRSYDVAFTIKPIGNVFELKGRVKTRMSELCSRCGWDLDLPVDQTFNEILMKGEAGDRRAQAVHGNQAVDFLAQGPDVTYYQGETFDAGAFIHEAIALSEPFYPSCGVEDCEHLEEAKRKQRELEAEFARAEEARTGHPAFSVLESLKHDKNGR